MTDSCDLLERLCNLPDVAGFEETVRKTIAGIVDPFGVPTRRSFISIKLDMLN